MDSQTERHCPGTVFSENKAGVYLKHGYTPAFTVLWDYEMV